MTKKTAGRFPKQLKGKMGACFEFINIDLINHLKLDDCNVYKTVTPGTFTWRNGEHAALLFAYIRLRTGPANIWLLVGLHAQYSQIHGRGRLD
jgi:hypothetical protein